MRPNPERLSGSDSDASTDASDDNFEKIDDGKELADLYLQTVVHFQPSTP